MKNINYRPEIDGLRALAVSAVIIFHAGVEQLSGGFIGVDIFYVISGFLITKIIFASLENAAFSFSLFYIRRMKRLLPAAYFMVLATVILGSFFLTPDKFVELSKSAIYSNLFTANVWFSNNSGYFDLSTQISPLVHMWSLSVEEQFYLIFPFILFFSYRIKGKKGIKFTILITIIVSFILSVLLTQQYPNFSFYMLHTRAWELGIGAFVSLHPSLSKDNKLLAHFLSIAGAILIVMGLFIISENDVYPGYLALFPVIGTALIIYSSEHHNTAAKSLLKLRPLMFLGKISYSAYLWHWPIVVYYRVYINQREFDSLEVILLILSSIFVGYLSWKYIEEKFRYSQSSNKNVALASLCLVTISVGIPFSIYISEGLPDRVSQAELAITDNDVMWDWACTEHVNVFPERAEKYCIIGRPWNNNTKKGIVWGDSHSQHFAQLLHHEALRNDISLVIAPRACVPYLNEQYVSSYYPRFPQYTSDCTEKNNLVLNWLEKNDEVNVVVMAAAWSWHTRMLYSAAETTNKNNKADAKIGATLSEVAFNKLLSSLGNKDVLILGDMPRPNKILNECAAAETTKLLRETCKQSTYRYLDAQKTLAWHKASDDVLLSMANKFPNVETIIPNSSLCDESRCDTYVNDELIYKDGNHIRRNLGIDTVEILSDRIGLGAYMSQ